MNRLTVRSIIVGLRRRGVTVLQIADRLGISESAVRAQLRPKRRPKQRPDPGRYTAARLQPPRPEGTKNGTVLQDATR